MSWDVSTLAVPIIAVARSKYLDTVAHHSKYYDIRKVHLWQRWCGRGLGGTTRRCVPLHQCDWVRCMTAVPVTRGKLTDVPEDLKQAATSGRIGS